MKTAIAFDNFPVRIVIASNLVSLTLYLSGIFIIYRTGLIFSILYFLYILALEIRLIRSHCTNCYYWGKTCGFGRGRISSLFFNKGDTVKFCSNDFTWKAMIPDLLVSVIPLTVGIVLLVTGFDILLLAALITLIVMTTSGNGYIRGKLTCAFCKQKEIGCPAYELFNRGKSPSK